MTAQEIADCAESVLDAGASIIHVHVRDDRGGHTLDVGCYRAAIAAIRERVGERLIIQVTTEASGIYEAEQQMAMVRELRPEAVSVALREICPDEDSELPAAGFYAWLSDEKIVVQHILYSSQDVARFEALRARGAIPGEKPFVLFVLGRYADGQAGDASALAEFVAKTADDTIWTVCCFGRSEHEAMKKAAAGGGHARVGFENNLEMADGSLAPDNASLVAAAVHAGRSHGRPPATAAEVRSLFA